VSSNGQRRPPRPRIEILPGTATEEETAAVAAALQRFLAETAPAPEPRETTSPWLRAALIEGVGARLPAIPPDPGSGFPLR
jgi:hypothetical protein